MRIQGNVEVSNRSLPSLNMRKRRSEKSYLSIGFVSSQKDKVFILHQTLNNSQGVKYKVRNNVSTLYQKFINQGKLTIRFVDPPVDLIVSGDPDKVKNFAKILKNVLSNDLLKVAGLCNLMNVPNKVESEPTQRLVIKAKRQPFPVFPRSLKSLEITDCSLTNFDNRILRLQNLRVLDLSNNLLEDLPKQIELLPCLEDIVIANNKLGRQSTFSWLESDSLRSNLVRLDLRSNELKFFPKSIARLKKLRNLLLDHNELKYISPSIGRLQQLKTLGVSHNAIIYLPGTLALLRLDFLDISGNPDSNVDAVHCLSECPPINLIDLAGNVVLKERLEYDEKILPRTLVSLLDNAGLCCCGQLTLGGPNKLIDHSHFSSRILHQICAQYQKSMGSSPLFKFTLCRQDKKLCSKY